MKKSVLCFTMFAFMHMTLFAQEAPTFAPQEPQPSTEVPVAVDNTAKHPVALGSSAAASSQAGRSTAMQNWIFAGTALVIAAIGVTLVAMNSGKEVK